MNYHGYHSIWYLSHSTTWVLNEHWVCTVVVHHRVKRGGSACASRMAQCVCVRVCVCVCACVTTSTTLHCIHTTCINHYSPSTLIQIQLHQLYNPTTLKVKVQFAPEHATKGNRGTALIFLFNLGARWGWMVNTTPWPLDPQEGELVPHVQEAGWVPGPTWTGAENLAPTGIPSPERPVRSESSYRLCYPGPTPTTVPFYF